MRCHGMKSRLRKRMLDWTMGSRPNTGKSYDKRKLCSAFLTCRKL